MTSTRAAAESRTSKPQAPRAWSWSSTLLAVIASIIALLIVQAWSATYVKQNTAELHSILSETRVVALEFERRIGYGGLIHNFKNYVLRSHEDGYRALAENDAEQALLLLDRLEAGARKLDVDMSLVQTRRMIESYTERLARVRELKADSISARMVDARVRFNDEAALGEVDLATSRLEHAIDKRVEELRRQEMFASLSSTAITATFGILLVGFVAWRRQSYTEELDALTDTLTEYNDKLEKANASLNSFAGIVSHDLKAPVRRMSILGEFIREDQDDPEAVGTHLHALEQQTSEMGSIIDSLLDFTEVGFSESCVRAFDLEHLLDKIGCDLKPELERAGGSIESDLELDEPVRADPELLSRVFTNLICNSLKYARSEEPARILVRAVKDGGKVVISVTDNGIGIEKRFAEKIFEPMQRLHGRHSGYAGVGIGLSLVKSIVESHGGAVWLDTEFVDGTRITFSLPQES